MKDSKEYKSCLERMIKSFPGMAFQNMGHISLRDTVVVMIDNFDGDLFFYSKDLSTLMYNNELFINPFKDFLERGNSVYVIVENEEISDEMLKVYKSYSINIDVRKANELFLSSVNDLLKDNLEVLGFFLLGNSFVLIKKDGDHIVNVCNYDDCENQEHIQGFFDDNFGKLKKINYI